MPEGPELRLAAQFVNEVGARYIFGGAVVKSDLATKHQEVDFKAKSYHVSAQSRGKEIKIFLQADGKESTCGKGEVPVRHLLFRFGMSGSFKFHSAQPEEIPKHAHLRFTTQDQKLMLSFVDYRRFGRWHINEDWGPDRGPDIIDEFNDFKSNIINNLEKPEFDKAICETMLNQKYFNGVGNYLRAEVLYRARVPPFVKARDALQYLVDEGQKKKEKEEDLLLLINKVMREVLELSGNWYIQPGADSFGNLFDGQDNKKEVTNFDDWLQCYMQDGMKNLVDRNSRTIWFSGDPGPMKPSNGKSRTAAKTKKRDKKETDHDYLENKSSKASKVKKEVKVKEEMKEEKIEEKDQGLCESGSSFSPLKTRNQRKR